MPRSLVAELIASHMPGGESLLWFRLFWFPAHGGAGSDHPPHWSELKLGLIFMAWFWLLREYIFGKLMIERLGAYLGIMIDSIALKLVNQWLNLGMHIFSTAFSIWYLWHQEWFYQLARGDSGALYRGITPAGLPMDTAFKAFYCLHLGYQLHALQFTIMEGRKFQGDRRTDFHEMLVHHVIAVSIIAISYLSGLVRVGVLTMLLHNSSDIVVCITKSAKLLGWRRLSVYLLPVMILTWAVARLLLFPLCVLRHILSFPFAQQTLFHQVCFGYCTAGIAIIVGLNIFWFVKFLQMCWRVVRHGHAVDVTESILTNEVADKYGLWNKQRWWQVGISAVPD